MADRQMRNYQGLTKLDRAREGEARNVDKDKERKGLIIMENATGKKRKSRSSKENPLRGKID